MQLLKHYNKCPLCKAKLVKHRHNLSKVLVGALLKFYDVNKTTPGHIKGVSFTHAEWDNWQKLWYFGLIAKWFDDGKRAQGFWIVTELGEQFILGKTSVNKTVFTFRGEPVETMGPSIFACEAIGGFDTIEEYRENMRPISLEEVTQ